MALTQLICLDGYVFADHDEDTDVPVADYPGAVIIPWDAREAVKLPRSPKKPMATMADMESPETLARHAEQHRHADRRYAPVPTTPKQLGDYAASVRHYRSIKGVTVAGVHYESDDDAERRIVIKWAFFQANPKGTLSWKTPSGFVSLDLGAFNAMAQGVATFREACFAAEAKAVDGIKAGSVRTMADIDAIFAAVG